VRRVLPRTPTHEEDENVRPTHVLSGIVVEDIHRAVPVRFGEVQVVPGFVRAATAIDPDGNRITLIETR
jgi:hypothetical protein